MADAVKDAVNSAVEGVKNLSVAAEQKVTQKENKAPKPKKEKKAKGDGGDGRPLMLDPAPAFIDHRIQIFEKLKAARHVDATAAVRPAPASPAAARATR